MNNIVLIGTIAAAPVYHCTERGSDLTRFQLSVSANSLTSPVAVVHHCRAWGPAALDLHQHLRPGDRLILRGELLYRQRRLAGGELVNVPVIEIQSYSYLGREVC